MPSLSLIFINTFIFKVVCKNLNFIFCTNQFKNKLHFKPISNYHFKIQDYHMVFISFTVFDLIDASRIGVVVVGPLISCVSKNFLDDFLFLLDGIPFVTYPIANINSAMDKIRTRFFFLI